MHGVGGYRGVLQRQMASHHTAFEHFFFVAIFFFLWDTERCRALYGTCGTSNHGFIPLAIPRAIFKTVVFESRVLALRWPVCVWLFFVASESPSEEGGGVSCQKQ